MIVKVTKVEYYVVPDHTDVDDLEWSAGEFYDTARQEFLTSRWHGADTPVIEDAAESDEVDDRDDETR